MLPMQSMPPTRHTMQTATNPQKVLESIGAGKGLDQSANPGQASNPLQKQLRIVHPEDEFTAEPAGEEFNPLVGMSDFGILQSTVESAKQIQQLASRLEDIKAKLVKREEAVETRLNQWHEAVETREQDYEIRISQLRQQASQVRVQQKNLLQLQEDIVRSNDAAKSAISAIVEEHTQARNSSGLVLQLRALKHELEDRFDYITRRWEQLHRLLENQRVSISAEQAIDDRVWWGQSR